MMACSRGRLERGFKRPTVSYWANNADDSAADVILARIQAAAPHHTIAGCLVHNIVDCTALFVVVDTFSRSGLTDRNALQVVLSWGLGLRCCMWGVWGVGVCVCVVGWGSGR